MHETKKHVHQNIKEGKPANPRAVAQGHVQKLGFQPFLNVQNPVKCVWGGGSDQIRAGPIRPVGWLPALTWHLASERHAGQVQASCDACVGRSRSEVNNMRKVKRQSESLCCGSLSSTSIINKLLNSSSSRSNPRLYFTVCLQGQSS